MQLYDQSLRLVIWALGVGGGPSVPDTEHYFSFSDVIMSQYSDRYNYSKELEVWWDL